MSRAYRSGHDGHAAARRLLHLVSTWRCLPNSSEASKRIGLAQKPHLSAVSHHVSKLGDEALRTISVRTAASRSPAGPVGSIGMSVVKLFTVLPSRGFA